MARKSKLEQYRRGFLEEEVALNERERALQAEREDAHRRLGALREQRRSAEVEAELVVIDGKPEPQSAQLAEIEAEIDSLAAGIDRDRWGAKLEACKVARRKLEQKRDDYLTDNLDAILAEGIVLDGEATEALREALGGVLTAIRTRHEVSAVLRGVLAKLPNPHDASTYRYEVQRDKTVEGLDLEIERRIESLAPLAPVELLRGEVGSDEEEAEAA